MLNFGRSAVLPTVTVRNYNTNVAGVTNDGLIYWSGLWERCGLTKIVCGVSSFQHEEATYPQYRA